MPGHASRRYAARRDATTRNGSSRADTVPKVLVSPTFTFLRHVSACLNPVAAGDTLDEPLIEVSSPARHGLQLAALFAKYFNSSGFCGLATAIAANVSISGRERHAEAVTHFFLGGCRELRRHMAGCLVCSGC
jgi:hypothetical protein